uniref:Uncharacterized protein n=1 Tax=Solanum lycopersicum TaxID=4081 RepID=A0A494G8B1_SOLLC
MQAIQSSSLRPSPVDPFLKTIPQFTNCKPLRPKRTPFISASSTTVSAPTREKDPKKRVVITGINLTPPPPSIMRFAMKIHLVETRNDAFVHADTGEALSEQPPLYPQQFFHTLLDLASERSM